MPVNPLPVLIPLLLLWLALAVFLFRWKKRAGLFFIGLSLVGLLINYIFTDVEKKIDEPMTFRLVDSGGMHMVELTTNTGEKFTVDSTDLFTRLQGRTNPNVRVLMTGWYDYGHMRAYHIQSVDGVALPP